MSSLPEEDYRVGRGRPPRHSRFQKGRSGNPGGRKRTVLNFKTLLLAVAGSEITVMENGRPRTVPILEGIVLKLAQKALSGDTRAIKDILDRTERCSGEEPAQEAGESPAQDQMILERAFRRRRAQPREEANEHEYDRRDGWNSNPSDLDGRDDDV